MKKPADCSSNEKTAFKQLVLKGGQVTGQGFDKRMEEANYLTFVYEQSSLLACGAIKIPSINYIKDKFNRAGVADNPMDYTYELGWIVTEEEARGRGIARTIVSELLKKQLYGRIFATSREDNNSMQRILESNGFVAAGKSFKSSLHAGVLRLFLK